METTVNKNEETSESSAKNGEASSLGARTLTAWKCFLISLATTAAVAVIATMTYHHYFALKVVAVDLKGYIQEQQDLYVAGKINDAQFNANLDRMEAMVLSLRNDKKGNRVVMTADVFLSKNVEVVRP